MLPYTAPSASSERAHEIRLVRWSRSASAVGLRSQREARGRAGRSGKTPAPTSRPAAIRATTASSATVRASESASGHQRSSTYARMFVAQPNGDSHESWPPPMSATPRSR